MLDERIVEKVIERLVGRVEEMNTYILEKMGGSVKKIGKLSPTQAQQLINILKYGGDYEDIIKKIAEVTEMNVADIQEIFKEVAKNDYRFAKQFYEFRNKPYIPFEENEALQNQIKALARITAGDYLNLSKTTAFSKKVNGRVVYTELAQTYHDLIDKAVLSVAQGKTAFNEQMYSTLKELASSGIKTIDYANGRSMRMDSAVRMTLKGALRNLHNETQKIIGEQFGADGVEISVHYNPAPDHAEVQGRQFSDEEFDNFQNDRDAVDYQGRVFTHNHEKRDRRSISQYNCYHYTFSIVLGVSKPQYSDEQLRMINEQNEKGFEMDGTRYTNYEGTQLQRKLETEIRKAKDTQIMARASGNDLLAQESQMRINELTYKYKELSKVSGLPTKADRLRISGYSPLRPSKKSIYSKTKKILCI